VTTQAVSRKRRLRAWIESIKDRPGVRIVLRILNVLLTLLSFVLRLAGTAIDYLLEGVPLLIVLGITGSLITSFGPYALNSPELVGRMFADWCIGRGACDLTTNLAGLGLGLYLSVGMVIFVIHAAQFHFKASEPSQSIYYDVRDELKTAGEAGITPTKIAARSGHEITDVHTVLGHLYDDGEAEIVEMDKTRRHVKYRLAKDDTDE